MAIENLIACLYPVDDGAGNALSTVNKPENKSFFLEPMGEDRSRAASEVTEDDGPYCNSNEDDKSTDDEDGNEEPEELGNEQDNFYTPSLCLRFDDYRKNRIGIVFGTSQQADIVLPRRKSLLGLAKIVCAITFDDLGRLVLKDLQDKGSKSCGTSVTYSGEGAQKRRGFTWILSGDGFTKEHKHLVIALHDRLKFRIVVAEYEIDSLEYQEQVALFRGRHTISADELTFDGLDVQSTSTTVVPSGAQTPCIDTLLDQGHHTTLKAVQPPGKKAILLNGGELGRGGQAIVSRMWDVSTGLEYAVKSPRETKFCHLLGAEISLLKQISHNHIVNMIGLWTTEPPQMLLEYIPLGTLITQHKEQALSGEETLDILCQCLSALQYIHELEKPIIHRDIKPGNILVRSRDPLHVKLSDFGYSRSGSKLITICGTPVYAAPEIPLSESYSTAVDIWSLGVVIFEYTHQLPPVTRPKDCTELKLLLVAFLIDRNAGPHPGKTVFSQSVSQSRSRTRDVSMLRSLFTRRSEKWPSDESVIQKG
ncbi:putative serine/threonine-protein kinase PRKY [Paramyrothecium foliicola]|nr:putative serine/threonine-protein kinase PRKY [Paramyrothecium foliicola]